MLISVSFSLKVLSNFFPANLKLPSTPFVIIKVKKRWEDMAGIVKKKERKTRNKELKRLKVTGTGHLEDQVL